MQSLFIFGRVYNHGKKHEKYTVGTQFFPYCTCWFFFNLAVTSLLFVVYFLLPKYMQNLHFRVKVGASSSCRMIPSPNSLSIASFSVITYVLFGIIRNQQKQKPTIYIYPMSKTKAVSLESLSLKATFYTKMHRFVMGLHGFAYFLYTWVLTVPYFLFNFVCW
jgi:hypothetical protein